MTDNLLKTALREAASREFAGMPQSDGDITYTFSPRFTRRMNRLTKAEKSWLWRMTSTGLQAGCGSGYCHDTNCADCLAAFRPFGSLWRPSSRGPMRTAFAFLPETPELTESRSVIL